MGDTTMKIGVSLPVREMAGDLMAIRDFAQTAEGLGLTHLRVPDQIMRPGSGELHEPMMMLAYIAAVTSKIELVPSVIILPVRQTVHFAKQAAELDGLGEHGLAVEAFEERIALMRSSLPEQCLTLQYALQEPGEDQPWGLAIRGAVE